MSPISNPCPHLVIRDNFYFCNIYPKRPKECVNHEYLSRFCPIGMDVLGIDPGDTETLHKRIDDGWEIIKGGKQ